MISSIALRVLVSCAAAASLGGCYIVPIAPPSAQQPSASIGAPPAAPQPIALNARLYPSNDAALRSGMVVAYLVNQRDGRGTFNVHIAGEQFNGEATRTGNSSKGTANAGGTRGNFINCEYTMNNPAQGTGSCALSTGATYSMHFGS